MNICFLSAYIGTTAGGTETVIYSIAKELSRRHNVTLITGSLNGKIRKEIRDCGFSVFTLPVLPAQWLVSRAISSIMRIFYRPFPPYCLPKLCLYVGIILSRSLRKALLKQDIVSLHSWYESLLFSRYLFKKGIPSLFYIPGIEGKDFFNTDRAGLYIANSQYTREKVEKEFNIELGGVMTPGSSNPVFPDSPLFENRRRNLLFLGRLEEGKGLFDLMEIFNLLKKVHPDLKLDIVGEGSLRHRLEKDVLKMGIKADVKFIGYVSPEETAKYYSSSLVLVFPSVSESFGIVVQEAMSCGLPVVASDLPAIRESSRGKAVLLDRANLELWVQEISSLIQDRQRWERISRESREAVSGQDWECKAQEYEDFLSKAATGGKIAVIVATYKRPDYLKHCLTSLYRQIQRPDRIIVVIHRGDTGSEDVLKELKTDIEIKKVYVEEEGIVIAENEGLKNIGDDIGIVCFIDDDAVAREDWIKNITRHYKDPRIAAVGGPALPAAGRESVLKRYSRGKMLWFGANIRRPLSESEGFVYTNSMPGCNLSFRRKNIRQLDNRLKGYSECWEEDLLLSIIAKGFKAVYDSKVMVSHYRAPIQTDYSRNFFDRRTTICAQHNNVYIYLKHHNLICRIIFIFFTFLIGDMPYPGFLIYIAWSLYKTDPAILKAIPSAFLGKLEGIKTFRQSKHICQ